MSIRIGVNAVSVAAVAVVSGGGIVPVLGVCGGVSCGVAVPLGRIVLTVPV